MACPGLRREGAAVQWGIELRSHEVHSLDCPQDLFLPLLKRNQAFMRQIICLSGGGKVKIIRRLQIPPRHKTRREATKNWR